MFEAHTATPQLLCVIPTVGRVEALQKTIQGIRCWAAEHRVSTKITVVNDRNAPRNEQILDVDEWIQNSTPLGQHRAILKGFQITSFDWGVSLEDDLKEDVSAVLTALWLSKKDQDFVAIKKVCKRPWWEKLRTWIIRRLGFGVFSRTMSALAIAPRHAWRKAVTANRRLPQVNWMAVGDKFKWVSHAVPLTLHASREKTTYTCPATTALIVDLLKSWWWKTRDTLLQVLMCVSLSLALGIFFLQVGWSYSSSVGQVKWRNQHFEIRWPARPNAEGECEVWDTSNRTEAFEWVQHQLNGQSLDLKNGWLREKTFVYLPFDGGSCAAS
jgi:hypothetical protein